MKGRHAKAGKRLPVLAAVCLVAALGLLAGVFAKYVYQMDSKDGQVLAENFYFTTALSGDTVMLAQTDASYSFGQDSTSGSWQLYGGMEHKLNIQVQNFYDALRVTERNITYTASLDAASTDAGARLSGTSGTLTGGSQRTETLTLTIPAHNVWAYKDDTTVALTIQSTEPYEKTFTLEFHLYSTDNVLKYRINDTVGSPYAELIIMNNLPNPVQPVLWWPDALDIDNTNTLTVGSPFTSFKQQNGMAGRQMQLSQAFETGRSESIAFFKENPSANYSKADTVVLKNSNGDYVIDLTK